MQELKRSKLKKGTNLDRKHSRKSIKSDNLHIPLTPSTFQKIKTSASRPSTAKSGSRIEQLKSVGEREPLVRLSHARPSEVPDNVAVHFASFYQNQDQTLPHSAQEKPVGLKAETSRSFPKMEFTRQMVYKLENSAGTQQYGRQVSAVLKDTVEAPGFNLKPPPIDNCAPLNMPSNYYPLWYRDPNKMPQISRGQFQEMKDKFQCKMPGKEFDKGIRTVKEPISTESETEVEFETETESEEDEAECKADSESQLLRTASKSSEMIAKSSRSTEKKDLKNSMINISARSIHCSSSEQSSSSSRTSCEIATEDDEEESLGWETDAEEEEEGQVTVKVVHNYRKSAILNQV